MIKNNKSLIFGIFGIFISYLIVQPIVIDVSYFQLNNLITPFLWSLFFIYLKGKNHALIGLNSYIIFLLFMLAEKINFGGLEIEQVLIYTILTMGVAFLFVFIYQEFGILKKIKIPFFISYIITFIFYLLPISFIIYRLNFDSAVTKDILYAVFQTNASEALEQVSDSISIQWLILFLFLSLLLGYILYKQEKKETDKIEKSLLIFITVLFIGIGFVQIKKIMLPKFIIDSFYSYNKELKSFEENALKRKKDSNITAVKPANSETYIVIIGESLNKKHMGIYNYFRDTTPNLSKLKNNNELLIFNNAYPNYVHTDPALSFALTQANQINKMKFQDAISILELLKKADIETYWLTNQGLGNNPVTAIAKKADHIISVNNSKRISDSYSFDEKLLKPLKKILQKKSKRNRVIFVHLMGSHAQYIARYPHNRFGYFKNNFKTIEVGKLANISHTFSFNWLLGEIKHIKDFTDFKSLMKKVLGVAQKRYNYYDNSVLYNDYIVSEIINMLKKEKGVRGVVYLSDHAEDLTHQLAHNASKFTFEMAQIPMIMWFSKKYINENNDKYKQLKAHENTLFSNGFLYDTLIGILNIKTDNFNTRFDFSSSNYRYDKNEAYILHGRVLYTGKNNFFYWEEENSKFLKDKNSIEKIVPNNVQSIGKLKEILYKGYDSFAIKTSWDKDSNSCKIDLKTLLSSADLKNIKTIILTVDNLDSSNINNLFNYLEKIDKGLNIKTQFILNFPYDLIKFKKPGWKIATKFVNNSVIKNADYIIVDAENYNEIQKISNKLQKPYIVVSKKALNDSDFQIITKTNFYKEQNVKYILVGYKSLFD